MILISLVVVIILNVCEFSFRVFVGIFVVEVGEILGGLFVYWNFVYFVGRKSVIVRFIFYCENIYVLLGDSERGSG